MRALIYTPLLAFALAGCSNIGDRLGLDLGGGARAADAADAAPGAPADPFKPEAGPVPTLDVETSAPPPQAGASTAEAFDTTTPEQRAAASAPAPETEKSRALGSTVASLGDPTQPGLWLKTPLVKTESKGRVTNPATGKSATVTLLPLGGEPGAGSQMSLAALRLVGASLADLTTVEVALAE